jgi:non-specific serine/threonine protein kinase
MPPTGLVGRVRELDEIRDQLLQPHTRLLTLTGPGGVGKTCLALHVAAAASEHFSNAVRFVPLATISDPQLVVPTIAKALGIPESGTGSAVESMQQWLRDGALLLVLDNLEQVIGAAPALAALLAACPGLTSLVTSRIPLHITGEREYAVQPLGVPDATPGQSAAVLSESASVQLFVQRSQAVNRNFALSEQNAPAVAEICRRLDGLPLAIELAAARTKLLGPPALLDYLGARLPLLTGGPRDAPARLRTMRDAIAWSYQLLAPDQQRLFPQLAVFVDGFTLEAVAAVVDGVHDSRDALDRIAALVDQSLLVPREDAGGVPRFSMLETIREFALDALGKSGEEQAVRRRHATYFRDLAERAEPALRGPDQPAWLARLEAELGNLRAVLDWSLADGDAAIGLRLAGALYWFWFLRNHYSEGRDWFARVYVAGDDTISAARAKAACGVMLLSRRAGDYVTCRVFAEEALRVFQLLDDRWGIAFVTHSLGHVAYDLDHDFEASIAFFEDSLAQSQAIDDVWGAAFSRRCLGAHWIMGQKAYARGAQLIEEGLRGFRQIGDQWNISVTLHMLGDAAREQRQFDTALSYYQECLAHAWAQRDQLGVADVLLRLAQILVERGDAEPAARLFGAAEAQHERAGIRLYWEVRAGYDAAVSRCRERLGDHRFRAVWAAGRALPSTQAVAEGANVQPGLMNTVSPGASHVRLSPRERDVLRLIAEGRPDREIAETLSIGVRTVHTHVTSILNKLGVSSRTAAATYAVRHGLSEPAPPP